MRSVSNDFWVYHPSSSPRSDGGILVNFHGPTNGIALPECLDMATFIIEDLKSFSEKSGARFQPRIDQLLDLLAARPEWELEGHPAHTAKNMDFPRFIFLTPSVDDPILSWTGRGKYNEGEVIVYTAEEIYHALEEAGEENNIMGHLTRMRAWFNDNETGRAFKSRFKGCDKDTRLEVSSGFRLKNNDVYFLLSCTHPDDDLDKEIQEAKTAYSQASHVKRIFWLN